MKNILKWFKNEIRKILGIACFFSVSFCLIVLAEKLMDRGSNVEIASFARAIFGGLIVAKVLLIVDLFPFVDRFRGKPLLYNILWKTPIYVIGSLIFRFLDAMIRSFFKGMSVAVANETALQEMTQPKFWATEIWIAMLLLIFVTMQELTRVLGKDQMRRIFLGP